MASRRIPAVLAIRSRPLGRPKIDDEIRTLIRRMKADNPDWGALRIHGELLALGFEISEPTVSRYLRQLKRGVDRQKEKRWLAFLHNHREMIAAFDFFTVPTLTFRVLYCFFVIEHDRRRILHFNTTAYPTSEWIVHQLREAFPFPCPYRYVIFDRDRKFGGEVQGFSEDQRYENDSHRGAEPLAERRGRALGGQYTSRATRSRDPAQ